MKSVYLLAAALTFAVSTVQGTDWPQWRGPDRTNISKETGLLKKWPEKGPKLLWTFKEAGLGFSGPAIVGDTLYTLGTANKDTEEAVLALDVKTGKLLWSTAIAPLFTWRANQWGDGPTSTPTIDGNLLYALARGGELVCLDMSQKGKVVWRKNLVKDFGGEMMTEWGFSESPIIDGDFLVCTPGSTSKGTLVALNKKTGEVLWHSTDEKNSAPYSSILPVNLHGVRQYVQNSFAKGEGGYLSGFEAKTGKLLWTAKTFGGDNYAICPNPVNFENLIYQTIGYDAGCHLYEISKTGDKFEAKDLYKKTTVKKVKNTHGGVVLIDGHIYGHSERERWICQELKTGAIAWEERDVLPCSSGAITAAEGMIYAYTDEGTVGLLTAQPKEFELVSEFKLPEMSKYTSSRPSSQYSKPWTHPVIANGRLYLRDAELIFCYEIKK